MELVSVHRVPKVNRCVYILGVQVGAHHELRSGVEPQTSTSLLLPRRSASAAKSSSTCGQLLFFKGRPYRFEGLNQGFLFLGECKNRLP